MPSSMKNPTLRTLTHSFALLGLLACSPDETISGQADPAEVFALTSLNGAPVPANITISFPKKGQIAGMAPCNSYSAAQTAPLPWFEPGPIRATRRACPMLTLETRYFDTLSAMEVIERKGGTLLLSAPDGRSLEFRQRL